MARAQSDTRFQAVLESAPDAAVFVDRVGAILWVNRQTEEFFGYARDEIVGHQLEMLLPERFRAGHVAHRDSFAMHPMPRAMGTGLELFGRRADGSEFPVDVSLSAIEGSDDEVLFLALVRDITSRKEADQRAKEAYEIQLHRQQALEINDVIVQGLSTAAYALESGDGELAAQAVRATISSARDLMGELLEQETDFSPGDLLRGQPAQVLSENDAMSPPADVSGGPSGAPANKPRVVVADDTPDLRILLRAALGDRFEIVAEAADGRQAIEIVERVQPDAILLDIAMPVMDGLQAIPEIKRVSPGTQIVVLSGYALEHVGDEALAAGAAAYLEKGTPLSSISDALAAVCGTATR